MGEERSRGHSGHSHGVSALTDLRWLTIALAINAGFMLIEVSGRRDRVLAGGALRRSAHAHRRRRDRLGAVRRSPRAAPAEGRDDLGLGRAEIPSAQANGLTLVILACFIVYEGIRRLVNPPEVQASLVLAIGLAGVAVNLAAALALARANRESLNVEGAFQHNLIDAYASVATAVAAGVILLTGFQRADPIASLLIAVPMLRSGYKLLKASGRIFLESAPEGLDPEQIGHAMAALPGVSEVHDLHVWEVTSGFPALSAHVLVPAGSDCHAKRRELATLLHDQFGIEHTTLQVEHQNELLRIQPPKR